MALGGRVRHLRELRGWTPTELARRAEVARSYVVKIERGAATRPSADVLGRLAAALGTTPLDLLDLPAPAAGAPPAVPAELQAFADRAGLPREDVLMLAGLRYRGEQPKSAEGWGFLYEAIRRSVREPGV